MSNLPSGSDVPANDLPDSAPAQSSAVPDHDLPDDLPSAEAPAENKYSSAGQQIGAGLEGLAQGFAGPLATGAELGLSKLGVPGVTAEDIAGRAEANPELHGTSEAAGLFGGLLTGTGEAGLVAKGVEALPFLSKIGEAGKLGKVASAAIKGGIETGLFQGGDEISKAMLGQGDPEDPVASALANMKTAALFGSVTGGLFGTAGVGLSSLADTKIGGKIAQFAEDFGNRWKFNAENPDLTETVQKELSDFHGSTADAADEVYGPNGLKSQAIAKLVPEMNPAIETQNTKIANSINSKMSDMAGDLQSYPPRLIKMFQKDVNAWQEVATNPNATSNDMFNATQTLKQKMQFYSKFDRTISPLSPEGPFVSMTKDFQHELKNHLEDPKAWGEAANLQKGINGAFTQFLPKLKDFNSKFTTKLEGEPVIDPGKVNTYVKQLGKPNAEIKQTVLKSYIDAAEKYRNKIAELHNNLGVESPIPPASINATKQTLNDVTAGAKFADWFGKKAPAKIGTIAGEVGGAATFGPIGYFAGKELAPFLESAIGRPITNQTGNALMKVLQTGSYDSAGKALQHASNVERGATKIKNSIEGLFKVGGQQYVSEEAAEADREKIKKFIEKSGSNQQLQNQLQYDNKQAPPATNGKPPGYAQGGEVLPPPPPVPSIRPDVKPQTGSLGSVYPEQDMLMQTAKGRVYNYLNSLKPQPNQPKLPFDSVPDQRVQQKKYDRAIDIAAAPLSVLNKVKNGTLTPGDVGHLNQMYPEIYRHLSKKITEKISQNQLDDEKPNYKMRQGLSLFLGAPMDSTFTPQGIMAAQGVFAQQKAQNQAQPQTKTKKNTSKLGEMSKSFQTSDQAAASRQTSER